MDVEEALDMTEVVEYTLAVEDIGADIEVESTEQVLIPVRTVSKEDIKSEHNYSAATPPPFCPSPIHSSEDESQEEDLFPLHPIQQHLQLPIPQPFPHFMPQHLQHPIQQPFPHLMPQHLQHPLQQHLPYHIPVNQPFAGLIPQHFQQPIQQQLQHPMPFNPPFLARFHQQQQGQGLIPLNEDWRQNFNHGPPSPALPQVMSDESDDEEDNGVDLNETNTSLQPRHVRVTANNYQKVIEELSTEISNLKRTEPDSKLELDISFSSRTLVRLEPQERSTIIQRFLSQFRENIIGLSLVIHGEESYLLQDEYRLPNLRSLFVNPPPMQYNSRINLASKNSSIIFEDLLIVYGATLKTLEVFGTWQINMTGAKYYPVHALEILNLSRSMSGTLLSLIVLAGPFITTLELYDIRGDNASGDECFLPNLKHLHIDSDGMGYFEIVRRNGENLESLIIMCHDRDQDFDPEDLPQFENLKLLEVNCPLLNHAILECCSSLEYLYVPEQGEEVEFKQIYNRTNMNLPTRLPALKDLCVQGHKKWSLNMIRKNCTTLEFLIVFGYSSLEDFLDDSDEEDEYCWPDLAAINCRFPKLKKLLLPGCTDRNIVDSLTAKCSPDVQVITNKKKVGKAVKARIYQNYSYTRYKRMMHTDLTALFKMREEQNSEVIREEMGGLPLLMDCNPMNRNLT